MGAAAQTLINLNPSEQIIMMKLLTPLDDKIVQRVKYIMNQHGLTQGEALEYVVTNNPILWAKVYLDWEARDYQRAIVVEAKKSKKLVLRLGRRLGKCLAAGEKVLNPVTGEYKAVEELYKAQEHTTVLSLDTNEKKLVPSGTSIFTDNGIKEVYKLTTEYGREIRCTANHPFWSDNQWKDLEELFPGDPITVAGDIKPPDSHHAEDWKVKHWAAEVRNGKPLPEETFLLNEEGLYGFIRYLYGNNEQMSFKDKDTAVGIQSLFLRGKQNARLYEENGCWTVQKTNTWSPLITERITAIKYIGRQQTYDLTVPGHHNFVVNDFITHNTDSICVMILWFAYTQINKGPNNKYDILIMTPYETQIDLIFKRLKQLIKMSPVLDSLVTKDIHHNIVITIDGVDSSILGLTAGANNSSGGANSSRGQAADVIVLDEVDYIGSTQLTNVLNIRNEAPERIRLLCASTPSGKHEEYYRWCIGASKTYRPLHEDIENNRFTDYKIEEVGKGEGNGWTQIYAPSNVNKELLKINPDTEQTYLEDIKDELSQMRYVQEVMAEFGEEEMGVYQKKYIQLAVEQGKIAQWNYITEWDKETRKAYLKRTQTNYKILGIDWDKRLIA